MFPLYFLLNQLIHFVYDYTGGRYHSCVKGKGGQSIVHYNCMKRDFRAILGFKVYHDIDMVNSSPNFALQVFNNSNLKTNLLSYYIEFREECLESVCQECQVSREAAKNLFIRLSFHGSAEKWCKENSVVSENLPLFVTELEKEMKHNMSLTIGLYPDIIDYQEKKNPNTNNKLGSQFALLIQTIERDCLHRLVEAITSDGFTIGALIHDGLLIERQESCDYPTSFENSNIFFGKWEKYVLEKTKFKIELCEKKMVVDNKYLHDVTPSVIIATDDDEASDAFLAEYKDIIKKTLDGRIFMRMDTGIWTCKKSVIDQMFLLQCLKLDIVDHKGNAYSKKVGRASGIIRAATAKVESDENFLDDLWESNRRYLCYKNGYWDFKAHKFLPWRAGDSLMSTMCIKRDFVLDRNEEVIQQVEKRLWEAILPDVEIRTFFKKYLARAMAGEVEEKCWCVCIGQRNTGKGGLISFLENAFGSYIQSTNAENFLLKGGATDTAKSQSWMMDHEFTRIAVSNEITLEDDKGRKTKINGNTIKRFTSGLDQQCARKNFMDETYFNIQARPFMMCNAFPPCDPPDALETVTVVTFPKKFVSQEEYDNISASSKEFYSIKDDTIKGWSKTEEVINAFTWTIFDAYEDKTPIAPECIAKIASDLKNDSLKSNDIGEIFEFTGDTSDYITVADMNALIKSRELSKMQLKNVVFPAKGVGLEFINIEKKTTRAWMCIKLKTNDVVPDDMDE